MDFEVVFILKGKELVLETPLNDQPNPPHVAQKLNLDMN